MYSYYWDSSTGGFILTTEPLKFSKEPRPVYYQELDMLGFDKYWNYKKDDTYPYMWAETNNYWYRGRKAAKTIGGSLYTAPKIEILDDPEPNNDFLKPVDVETMVKKNHKLIESLTQNTIKKVYNIYNKYKNRANVFYVAFSGGKDSVVALDVVQRALPHNAFKVIFGDTDMEFPTTIELTSKIEQFCLENNISFLRANANMKSSDSWDLFGPPARRLRWCCTVHKTAPVINKLCDVYNLDKLRSVMITGVRADESISRSNYDELSLGKKMTGQFSFHPLLDWSSAEIYLYIYENKLLFNEAYKYGFNRVGCIMCPNSSEKHEYIKRYFFKEQVDEFCDRIIRNSSKDLSGNNAKYFLEIGGWKTRLSGRELRLNEDERYTYKETKEHHIFYVPNLKLDWKIWYKTIGELIEFDNENFILEFQGVTRKCKLDNSDTTIFYIQNLGKTKNSIEFIYLFKNLLVKNQYCIKCGTCEAECPHRNISMKNGKLKISNKCVRCHECLKIISGCIYYNSIKGSNNMKNLKGVNKYLSVGVNANWIYDYFKNQNYEPGNRKTDVMFGLLTDANIIMKRTREFTDFGKFVKKRNLDDISWQLMLCNLVYTPAFNWYIKNIPFNETYYENRLLLDMGDDVKKKASEFWNSFKVILDSNKVFQDIGFGYPDITSKITKSGVEKKTLNFIEREPWRFPEPLVILYSLYKFSEACDGYYEFTLTRLLNHDIESEGISPTEIFGLDRDKMEQLLTGLSMNYHDFINATFTIDLDNITLRKDKKSSDVLTLFEGV